MRLEGKVAFISGGARGMGAVEARLFAREGARVAIGDVLEREGRQVAVEIGEAGGRAIFVPLDISSVLQGRANNFGVLATNIFVRTPAGWRMIAHHAPPQM